MHHYIKNLHTHDPVILSTSCNSKWEHELLINTKNRKINYLMIYSWTNPELHMSHPFNSQDTTKQATTSDRPLHFISFSRRPFIPPPSIRVLVKNKTRKWRTDFDKHCKELSNFRISLPFCSSPCHQHWRRTEEGDEEPIDHSFDMSRPFSGYL